MKTTGLDGRQARESVQLLFNAGKIELICQFHSQERSRTDVF